VSAHVRQDFQVFMHTLLARRLAVGVAADAATLRHAMEDVWCDPLVNRRWQRVSLRLTEADCERLVQYAGRRGLAGDGWRWVPREAATEGWALERRGFASHCGSASSMARAGRSSEPQRASPAGATAAVECAA